MEKENLVMAVINMMVDGNPWLKELFITIN